MTTQLSFRSVRSGHARTWVIAGVVLACSFVASLLFTGCDINISNEEAETVTVPSDEGETPDPRRKPTADGDADRDTPPAGAREAALAYGETEGAAACDYLSSSAIVRLGGRKSCTRKFRDVPAATFSVEEITVVGDTATARVENQESGQEIRLELVYEDDRWKVSNFPGL